MPGQRVITPNGVTVLGYHNWPARIAVAAQPLYARNLLTFLTTFWDKDAKAPKLPADDDIVKGVHAHPRRRRRASAVPAFPSRLIPGETSDA